MRPFFYFLLFNIQKIQYYFSEISSRKGFLIFFKIILILNYFKGGIKSDLGADVNDLGVHLLQKRAASYDTSGSTWSIPTDLINAGSFLSASLLFHLDSPEDYLHSSHDL